MRRLFALVATVVLVDAMFIAALVPLLPTYVDELGISKAAAGVLSASYAAGTLLGSLPAGLLAARAGVRPAMLIGLGLLASSSVAFAFADQILILDLARFAQGVGGAFAWTAGFAWMLGVAPAGRRGELIGAIFAAAIVGLLFGPVLGVLAIQIGSEAVFLGVAVIAAALIAWTVATPGVAPSPVTPLRQVAAALLRPPVLVAFWLVALPSVLAGLLDVLAPLRLDVLGASGLAVGAVFLVAAAVEAVISPGIGRLSDRRGRMFPIRLGLAASVLAALFIPLPASVIGVGICVLAIVLAMSLIWTPAMALLAERTEAAEVDLAFGMALNSLAWAGGQVVGAAALTAVADASADIVAYGVVAAAFAVTLLALLRSRPRPAA
jgi:predicted MFS family arabinose efflux permease